MKRSILGLTAFLLLVLPAPDAGAVEPVAASVNSLGMRMSPIAPGSFTMGSTEGNWDEQPTHRVTLTQPFQISPIVTLAQYQQFRSEHTLSAADAAVTGVSWYDAAAFCRWLSEKEAKPYRLPTEAEWEYVHRVIAPAAKLDMTGGSLAQWCYDWYGPYKAKDQTDPVGAASGLARVVRGDKPDNSRRLLKGRRAEHYRRPENRAGMAPGFGLPHPSPVNGKGPGTHAISFRIVQAPLPETKPSPTESPFFRKGVKQATTEAARKFGPDPKKPYFRKRYLLPTPPETSSDFDKHQSVIDAAGLHPAFAGHNHSPAMEVMPNGDILVAIFTSWREYEPEMSLMFARLRLGADEWEMPSYGVDMPDACDNCPLLETNGSQVRLFWSNTGAVGRFPFQWVTSVDSGATWNEVHFPQFTGTIGPHSPQPINSVLRDPSGAVYVASDGSGASSVLWVSRDNLKSWKDPGGRTAGRHTTFALLSDGKTILGLGGKNSDIGGFMPQSLSTDGGKTWTISKSVFPSLGNNQRPCLLRLASGRLFFCGDFQRGKDGAQPPGINQHGALAALSDDEGRTWKIKKLVGAQRHEHRKNATIGYSVARQAPDGVIHLITTMNRPCLHFAMNEAWILSDRPTPDDDAHLMTNTARNAQGTKRCEEKYKNGRVKIVWHAGVGDDGRYLLNGKETWYFPEGGTRYEATYALGRKVGDETLYQSDGSKVWRWVHHPDGVKVWTQYWPNGRKKAESSWQDHRAHGRASRWDADGKLLSQARFDAGEMLK